MSRNQREDVRQRIMDCAVEEFLMYGYSGSSMRNISTQAGMTVGNVYAYFSSKDDLFDQVVEPARRGIDSLLAMDVDPFTQGCEVALSQISEAIVQVFLAYRSQFLILSRLAEMLGVEQKNVMAIGDNINDVSMVEWAGTGVCVREGQEALKRVADLIVPEMRLGGLKATIEYFIEV